MEDLKNMSEIAPYVDDKKCTEKYSLSNPTTLNLDIKYIPEAVLDSPRSTQLPSDMVNVTVDGMAVDCRISECSEYDFGTSVYGGPDVNWNITSHNPHSGLYADYINNNRETILLVSGGITGSLLLLLLCMFLYKTYRK